MAKHERYGLPCVVCGDPHTYPKNQNTVLICEGCDAHVHQKCLNPPLADVPEGPYFCDLCAEPNLPDPNSPPAPALAATGSSGRKSARKRPLSPQFPSPAPPVHSKSRRRNSPPQLNSSDAPTSTGPAQRPLFDDSITLRFPNVPNHKFNALLSEIHRLKMEYVHVLPHDPPSVCAPTLSQHNEHLEGTSKHSGNTVRDAWFSALI